jgi:hypothetical protein
VNQRLLNPKEGKFGNQVNRLIKEANDPRANGNYNISHSQQLTTLARSSKLNDARKESLSRVSPFSLKRVQRVTAS